MPVEKDLENAIPLLDVNGADHHHADQEAGGIRDALNDSDHVDVLPLAVPVKSTGLGRKFLIWTAINMAATIGIVFTNKAIFNDPKFKLMQTSFASFHFVCTGLTLWIVSRPGIGAFVPKRAGVVEMLPVSCKAHDLSLS